ncbi:MAG TPA: hypothetical protein VEF03_07440 [Candidatus Binataceae bacterium]|nr:hypothetical protein [Candidatus Binataceae bacterium]
MSSTTHYAAPGVIFHPDTIHYREYKLLLKAARFGKPQAFHKFWKLTRHVAKSVGVDLRKAGKGEDPHVREVLFFDTPKFRLYNHNFILRRRTFYKNGVPRPEHELTFKFRCPNMKEAAAVDVRPLLPCINQIKFKEEILTPHDGSMGMRTIFSHTCELDTPNTMLTQDFETIAEVFPALRKTGAREKAALAVVNNLAIDEILVDVGEFNFGDKFHARATLAIWRNRVTGDYLVGEYAYQVKFANLEEFREHPRKASEAFYVELQKEGADWIESGTTKTAIIYGSGKMPITNHE